jgi:GDP-L-fucose synthase
MKLLILGSNGFVGRHLVEEMAKGSHEILAPKRDTLDLVVQDAVEQYLKEHRPDVVINCAVTISSAETNLHIYYNLERCAAYFGRLLNVGSGAEYAPKYYKPMMDESYFGQNVPGDTYGISKFCIAKDIERSQHDFINLRVFGIFGEYEDHSRRFITNNICASIREQKITVNRNSVFDYLDVKDFVRIVERFLTLDAQFKSYNVCTAQPKALVELAEVIDQVSPYINTLTVVDNNVFSTYVGDNTRLLNAIGDFDFTPVETSVARLFDWYQAEFDAGRIR